MSEPLILALPSKGRLKEQVEAWLADCGLVIRVEGGARSYLGTLEGFAGVQVRLASAADVAAAVIAGEAHVGITGEDLLRELAPAAGGAVILLRALGFGRADLVVAAPRSWIDVDTMADIDDVAHLTVARTGRRLRVATKYPRQARAFFAGHGIADYRLIESGGATEGAPASGAAEIIVDITTTGETLVANGLKVIDDGVILESQAQLAAGLRADWDGDRLASCRRLLALVEARARAQGMASLAWPDADDEAARKAVAPFAAPRGKTGGNGVLVARADLLAATSALGDCGVNAVSVTHPVYLFDAYSEAAERLAAAVTAKGQNAGYQIRTL